MISFNNFFFKRVDGPIKREGMNLFIYSARELLTTDLFLSSVIGGSSSHLVFLSGLADVIGVHNQEYKH